MLFSREGYFYILPHTATTEVAFALLTHQAPGLNLGAPDSLTIEISSVAPRNAA